MEIFTIVIICVIVFLVFFLCGYCCKRSKSGRVLHPPVTVTSTHVTATPVVQPPYPTNTHYPMPQPMPQPLPPPGVGFVGDGYQTAPYLSMPGQNMIPQPAAPPPSYNEAMSQPPVQSVTVTEHYAKQSPYNPNF
ncbi:hypothetical protein QE152_g27631 [Popillia japonica]|uniref:Uncharacterized protein n=1 Tax=Popillia japonica TaxID=7064 RepID=A0AAW1JRA1_POPJA